MVILEISVFLAFFGVKMAKNRQKNNFFAKKLDFFSMFLMVISPLNSLVPRHSLFFLEKWKKIQKKNFENFFENFSKFLVEIFTITIFTFFGFFKNRKQTPKYYFPPIFFSCVHFFKNLFKKIMATGATPERHLWTHFTF